MRTLDACSSQAGAFPWSEYIEVVRERIYPLLGQYYGEEGIALPSNLLLMCVDSLCIMQRLPEEHMLTVSEPKGCITLIVWAHHVLDLSVLLQGPTPAQNILFSRNMESSPNVIIQGTMITYQGPEICLLDRKREVQLRIDPSLAEFVRMEARERLPLCGYSSVNKCRDFNEPPSFRESLEFHDAVEYAIAMAIVLSRNVARAVDVKTTVAPIPCSIKNWQIFEAAAVLFSGVNYEEAVITKYADEIPLQQPLIDLRLNSLPCALRSYLSTKEWDGFAESQIGKAAVDLLVMATVADIGSCGRPSVYC